MQPIKRVRSCRPALRLQILEDRSVPSFGLGWAFNMGAGDGWGVATDNSGSALRFRKLQRQHELRSQQHEPC